MWQKKLLITLTILVVLTMMVNALDEEKGGGFGIGGHGDIRKMAITNTETYIGKYHDAVWDKTSPANVINQNSFNLKEYEPIGNKYNSKDYAKVIGEPKLESRSEIPIAIFNLYSLSNGGTVRMDWYKEGTNKRLYTFTHTIPNPKSKGYDYWAWYTIYSWVGYFPSEIDTTGRYKAIVSSPFGGNTIYFSVNDKEVKEEIKALDVVNVPTSKFNILPILLILVLLIGGYVIFKKKGDSK